MNDILPWAWWLLALVTAINLCSALTTAVKTWARGVERPHPTGLHPIWDLAECVRVLQEVRSAAPAQQAQIDVAIGRLLQAITADADTAGAFGWPAPAEPDTLRKG